MEDDLSSLFICEDYSPSDYSFALNDNREFNIKLLGIHISLTF